MTFRTRLVLAFTPVALLPLVGLALIVRSVMHARFVAQFDERVASQIEQLERDLTSFSQELRQRLAAIGAGAADDNRFRLALSGNADRAYLLDYAARAMQLSGLDVLQIQTAEGTIVSSGHFRNAFDRVEPVVTQLLGDQRTGAVQLVQVPTGELVAVVVADSFQVGGRWLHVLGGLRAARFLDFGVVADDMWISLRVADVMTPDGLTVTERVTREIVIPWLMGDRLDPTGATLVVGQSLAPLEIVQAQLDRMFFVVFGLTAALSAAVAVVVAAGLSKPISRLAERTKRLDLDNLDVEFRTERNDEIGDLTRLFGSMVNRIKTGASRLREAERRAAVGDLARQITHDIKNGLVPIRNVFDHLVQVHRNEPAKLVDVFDERRETVLSSVKYLENLAAQYAKLSPATSFAVCDVADVIRDATRTIELPPDCELRIHVNDALPRVRGDRLALRRIVENLMGNAVDSLDNGRGTVTIACDALDSSPSVQLTVSDTGRGMTQHELERSFEDFYTTKPTGTGLGLSVVRRLIGDLGGSIRIETAPGVGTTVIVDLPTHRSGAAT